MKIPQGSTDVSLIVELRADGTDILTVGITPGNLELHYWRAEGTPDLPQFTAITALSAMDDAHADSKMLEVPADVGATGVPLGLYRLDLPDALFAVGADRAWAQVTADAGTAVHSNLLEFELVKDIDGYSLEEAMRLMLAHSCGERAGGDTGTVTFKAADGSKVRVTMVVDAQGNSSSAPTLDET